MRSTWTSRRVRALTPYTPGEQPKDGRPLIKLNTNENPYGPGEKAAAVLRDFPADTLRLYPNPAAEGLRAAFARHAGLDPAEVYVSNSSDEVLSFAYAALFDGGSEEPPLLIPDPGYGFYPIFADYHRVPWRLLPLDENWEVDIPPGIEGQGLVLADPNAPTGIALKTEAKAALLDRALAAGWPVILDEAYIAFGGETAAPWIRRYPNLLVVRTLSKSHGLAGLRVGAAFGQPELIRALETVRDAVNAYPLDRVALAVAEAALDDAAWTAQTVRRIVATRERFSAGLRERGFEVLPSAANFVFARHPDCDGATLLHLLRGQGILVRHFSRERLRPWIRITIGTDSDMERFLDVLDLLAEGRSEYE
ncbi:MAG: aminotransferase class I/II-fold pyridoxal phosphate-dependent enzyme [Bacillota bacterium]|nr:aminotransferase class I/II-fold pyridoxal phosphate-dependent enzyme [Bacillota bacterium]